MWSDTVPLCQECLHDVGGDDIGLRCAAATEDALALVEEDHRRLVVPRLIPYLAHTLPAGSKLLLLEVGDRELLIVALHRLGQAASDQRLACTWRSGQEQSARSGLVPNLEHIGPLQQLVHLLFRKEDLAPSCNLPVQSRELLLQTAMEVHYLAMGP